MLLGEEAELGRQTEVGCSASPKDVREGSQSLIWVILMWKGEVGATGLFFFSSNLEDVLQNKFSCPNLTLLHQA